MVSTVLMFKWGPLVPLQVQGCNAVLPCCMVSRWGGGNLSSVSSADLHTSRRLLVPRPCVKTTLPHSAYLVIFTTGLVLLRCCMPPPQLLLLLLPLLLPPEAVCVTAGPASPLQQHGVVHVRRRGG